MLSVLYLLKYHIIVLYLAMVLILILIDILFIKAIDSNKTKSKTRTILKYLHWSIALSGYIWLFGLVTDKTEWPKDFSFHRVMQYSGYMYLTYFPKMIFLITYLFLIPVLYIRKGKAAVIKVAITLGITTFLLLLYGISIGRFNFEVKKVALQINNLPASFKGYKIVQISDLHLAGFYGNENQLKKAVDIINKLDPDLILFTGDLVNNYSSEALPYVSVLSKLKSKDGKYSILGNHDYGDYAFWKDSIEKENNLKLIYEVHRRMGFTLLDNTHSLIRKNNDSIYLAGVGNWGKPPFPQYGDIIKALSSIPSNAYIILMTHDPSHWELEIKNQYSVALSLSGHTHGMQHGIDLAGIKWSPASWKYKEWQGLYHHNGKYLYVNAGLGSIGVPSRVGINPEISLITLN